MKMKRDFTKLYPVFRLYGDMKIILDASNQTNGFIHLPNI